MRGWGALPVAKLVEEVSWRERGVVSSSEGLGRGFYGGGEELANGVDAPVARGGVAACWGEERAMAVQRRNYIYQFFETNTTANYIYIYL